MCVAIESVLNFYGDIAMLVGIIVVIPVSPPMHGLHLYHVYVKHTFFPYREEQSTIWWDVMKNALFLFELRRNS